MTATSSGSYVDGQSVLEGCSPGCFENIHHRGTARRRLYELIDAEFFVVVGV